VQDLEALPFSTRRSSSSVDLYLDEDHVGSYSSTSPDDAEQFLIHLASIRHKRELLANRPLVLADDKDSLQQGVGVIVPHFWSGLPPAARITWELLQPETAEAVFDARADVISRWSNNAVAILDAIQTLPTTRQFDEPYFSFRWIVRNERDAAAFLTSTRCKLDHVSVHVDPSELDQLTRAFEVLGFLQVERPPQITAIPGTWLVGGLSMVHLNARTTPSETARAVGTAPHHICLSVDRFSFRCQALRAEGLELTLAGSLGRQAWFTCRSGTVVEIQPLPPEASS